MVDREPQFSAPETNVRSIDVPSLVGFFNELANVVDQRKAKLLEQPMRPAMNVNTLDRELALGSVHGAEEVLNSWAAFLIAHSADMDGQIEKFMEEHGPQTPKVQ